MNNKIAATELASRKFAAKLVVSVFQLEEVKIPWDAAPYPAFHLYKVDRIFLYD